MKFSEYQESAFRTMANLGTENLDMSHMALGIATELGELADIFKKNIAYKKDIDWVNASEEVGDVLWYVSNFFTILNTSIAEYTENVTIGASKLSGDRVTDNISAILYCNSISGCIDKELLWGGKSIDKLSLKSMLGRLVRELIEICAINGFDISKIMDNNINKLKIRYPDKFSEYNATHRNLDEERKELER